MEGNDPVLTTWTFAGVRFYACFNGNIYHIVDESNRNYGAWQTPERFRHHQQKQSDLAKPLGESSIARVQLIPTTPAKATP